MKGTPMLTKLWVIRTEWNSRCVVVATSRAEARLKCVRGDYYAYDKDQHFNGGAGHRLIVRRPNASEQARFTVALNRKVRRVL